MSTNSSSQKQPDQRSKSCGTACSSNSSCFFQKRKPINPLASSLRRSSLSRSTTNSVKQRVLSAKILKLKTVQNQLNDANFHLAEVVRENQALKTLQKRQDKALSKYEGANAELPRLIQSHEEEIRFLTEKNKTLRRTVKDLSEQLKYKHDEVLYLQEQLKHYEKLDKDKNLLEREKLLEEIEELQHKLTKADEEVVILNRKLTLENKTSRQRLNGEMLKHKQAQKDLAQAFNEINRLSKLPDSNGKKRFSNLIKKSPLPVTDIKLEPIAIINNTNKPYKSILKCPSENIKARLSAESGKDEEDLSLDKMSISGGSESSSIEKDFKMISRPNSSLKLEKIEMDLQNSIRKVEDNRHNDEVNQSLSNYCLQAIDNVKNYDSVIENHKENFENAKDDTEKIMKKLEEAKDLEIKLQFLDGRDLSRDNLDIVNRILNEEAEFQKSKESDTKKRLLATLRAIDNGDSVASFEEETQLRNASD